VQSLVEEARRVLVLGSDAEAVMAVRNALTEGAAPEAAGYLVETVELEAGGSALPLDGNGSVGVAVLVAGSQELAAESFKSRLAQASEAEVPVVLVLTEAPGIQMAFPGAGVGPRRIVGIAPDGTAPADVLAEAVVDAAGEGAVALASRLPALRDEACGQLITHTARQNAVVGVLFFLPGTDMPVMTLNEARMVLRIAAAHGEPVGKERALELLGVVGSGFGLRAAARQLLNFLPGPGWAIKGGVAYSGTQAIGRAAQAYFDGSVRLTPSRLAPLVDRVKQLRG
jgi:uncharacterized protein (DUF697 family)